MYNNTSKILPFYSQNSPNICGVILPHSDKILGSQDIDKKIESVKKHIAFMTQKLSHRNTHGGKRFRAREISSQDQISISRIKLELLQMAKTTITKVNIVAPKREVSEYERLLEKTRLWDRLSRENHLSELHHSSRNNHMNEFWGMYNSCMDTEFKQSLLMIY